VGRVSKDETGTADLMVRDDALRASPHHEAGNDRNRMTDTPDFSHLPTAAARLGAVMAKPKLIAVGCVVLLTGLGWLTLAWLMARMGGANGLPVPLQAFCTPLIARDTPSALIALMWAAMTLAMMLPTAGPMILTYAEIAETAARKGEQIVSPLVLAAGYGSVWAGFALTATLAQLVLMRLALLDSAMGSASALLSGAVFMAAGLYQFTPLKHACLTQCQRPFPFFFAHWQTTAEGVFRLGLRQGLYCLGCCWAMMLLMFAVGVMNVIWMAALGVVMTIEKIGSGRAFSHAVGAAMVLAGAAFVVAAVGAHWPGAAV
jgi:predicted metal-binding membrane protein